MRGGHQLGIRITESMGCKVTAPKWRLQGVPVHFAETRIASMELPPVQTRQVRAHGLVRITAKDVESILAVSGDDGVFLSPAKNVKIPPTDIEWVEWIPPTDIAWVEWTQGGLAESVENLA